MIRPQKVIELDVQLDPRDILRVMGCRRGKRIAPEVESMLERVLEEAEASLRPRCAYSVHQVERMTDTRIDLAGCPPFHGPIAGFLRPATRVAAFVITLGDNIEKRARCHMETGALLEGYTWDAVGSAAADMAVDALTQHLLEVEAAEDEAVTPPFSPGYCGMALEEQKTLFSIVDASPIGVKLWPTCIMEPIKSVSGLMGIGPSEEVVENGVPCQWCHLDSCKMRR